jgi:hypothetical protein
MKLCYIRVEIWGWEITDGIQGRFCKKVLRFPEARLMEQQNLSFVQKVRGGKTLCLVEQWCTIMQMGPDKLVGRCYVLQVGNLKLESLAINFRSELGKLGLEYI